RIIKLYKREKFLEISLVRDNWYGTGKNAIEGKIRETRKIYKMMLNTKTVDEFERLYNDLCNRLSES
ncbi:MAG: hypothetical protein RMH84_07215, partial [Sulfolobales archaeon]|nr:hypothetical protein [Sulfolobales archaeon]